VAGLKEELERRISEVQRDTFLSQRMSQVYVLIVEEGWETGEVAEQLGIDRIQVNVHLSKVRKRIRKAEGTAGLESPGDRRKT